MQQVIVTPEDIGTYAICSKKSEYQWGNHTSIPWEAKLFSSVVKRCYTFISRYEKVPTWPQISYWIDLEINSMYKEEAPQTRYKYSVNILMIAKEWYDGWFKHNVSPGLINFPILLALGNHLIFKDDIDIITIGDSISIIDFKKINHGEGQVRLTHDDLTVQSRIWGVEKYHSKLKVDKYIRFNLGTTTSKCVTIHVNDKMRAKQEKYVSHILDSIRQNIYYPSISEHCKGCPFYNKCSF